MLKTTSNHGFSWSKVTKENQEKLKTFYLGCSSKTPKLLGIGAREI